MTKKILGICLIVLGCIIFAVSSYGIFQNVFQAEQMKANTEQQLVEQGFSADQIHDFMQDNERISQNVKILISFIAFVGLGFAVGGFYLFRKGKKDAQYSGNFKFD
jgi:flagellar basal body-associated protein FliL